MSDEHLQFEIPTDLSARIDAAMKGAMAAMLKSESCFVVAASTEQTIAERRVALDTATAALDEAERHFKAQFAALGTVFDLITSAGHDVTKNIVASKRAEETALEAIEKERAKARGLDRMLQLGGGGSGSA